MNGTSFIITFYQGVSSLELCLSLLLDSLTNESDFEIVVVNDNPTVKLTQFSDKTHTRIINMPQNLGYASACNVGAKEALFDTLLFMDCDIYPTGDWFQQMKKTYSDIKEKGCVSATIYETDTGNLFGYGMGVYEVDILLFLRHGKPTNFSREDRDVPIVSSGCMLVNRDCYLNIGGQDELCYNIHCDVDLSFRLLNSGFHNRMCAKAVVFHRGQVSGTIRTVPFKQDVKAYLFKKWGQELTERCNTEQMLHIIWSYFKGDLIEGKKVVVVSVSNSLYRLRYIEMLAKHFNLEILQFHDKKNITGADNIILQEILSWDICRLNLPIMYFADDYRILCNNYYWYCNRAFANDLICDKNGNLFYTSQLEHLN